MTAAGEKGQPLVEDSFFPTILDAVKNVNFHVGDGKYNRTKINKALRLRKKLETLQKSADPKVKEMADHYLKWVKEIEESVDWDRATNGVFEQYLPKLDAQKPKEKPPFKVERGKVTHTKRRIGSGTITVEVDDIDNRTLFNHNWMATPPLDGSRRCWKSSNRRWKTSAPSGCPGRWNR